MSGAVSTGRRAAAGPSVLESAKRVLDIEIEALRAVATRLDGQFEKAVELIGECSGRTVVTGMGKSGQVCRKMAATFSSTGTSSIFLHAAEAAHGDIGILTRGDVCIGVSNSGTTEELLSLLPAVKRLEIPLIAITGGLDSPLASAADALLDVSVAKEACPLGLAPTASTTATLAVGDALAVAVLERKGFSEDDFAVLHPGGALGRRLLRVAEIMRRGSDIPLIGLDAPMKATLEAMTEGKLGTVGVVDDEGALAGVITDGDIRRAVLSIGDTRDMTSGQIMTSAPKTIAGDVLAAEALAMMEKHSITSLFILDDPGRKPAGIIHMHDLLRAGIA